MEQTSLRSWAGIELHRRKMEKLICIADENFETSYSCQLHFLHVVFSGRTFDTPLCMVRELQQRGAVHLFFCSCGWYYYIKGEDNRDKFLRSSLLLASENIMAIESCRSNYSDGWDIFGVLNSWINTVYSTIEKKSGVLTLRL
jgi:hypothetical protein